MSDFLAAIGLVLVIEGLVYGGFPALAKRLATEVLTMPENALRIAGLAAIAAGVGIVWLRARVTRGFIAAARFLASQAANAPYFLPT